MRFELSVLGSGLDVTVAADMPDATKMPIRASIFVCPTFVIFCED